jgi:hypothetical protein
MTLASFARYTVGCPQIGPDADHPQVKTEVPS